MQRANFINVERDFINAEKQIHSLWNLNMKKHSNLAFKFKKHDQKIILCRMLGIVYAENNEQFLWENSEQFYLMQKIDFMNAVSRLNIQ